MPTPKTRPNLAPLFVDLDEDLRLTAKVGPCGLSVPVTMVGLIKFIDSRL